MSIKLIEIMEMGMETSRIISPRCHKSTPWVLILSEGQSSYNREPLL